MLSVKMLMSNELSGSFCFQQLIFEELPASNSFCYTEMCRRPAVTKIALLASKTRVRVFWRAFYGNWSSVTFTPQTWGLAFIKKIWVRVPDFDGGEGSRTWERRIVTSHLPGWLSLRSHILIHRTSAISHPWMCLMKRFRKEWILDWISDDY